MTIDAKFQKTLGAFRLDAEFRDSGFTLLSGPNGSGKTTFLSVVAGTLPPDHGYVKVGSLDVTRLPIEKRRTVLVSAGSYIPHFDVKRHLLWGASLRKVRVDDGKVGRVTEALGVPSTGRLSDLSLGTKARVSLATALLSSPDVILVDELFSNIDNRRGALSSYRDLAREEGIDVIVTSQSSEGFEAVDHRYTIAAGKTQRQS